METELERLQRTIFSVDTEAGYRFRYHLTRARACEDYRELISMGPSGRDLFPAGLLATCFIWHRTREGDNYWSNIYNLLKERNR